VDELQSKKKERDKGFHWEEKQAMKEDARAAKQCMQLVWESNDASDTCLDVKAELDAVMQDVTEILAEQSGRERGDKGGPKLFWKQSTTPAKAGEKPRSCGDLVELWWPRSRHSCR
jgi:hypothetical protein